MSYISPSLRRFVAERAGNCCEYCLISQDDDVFPFEIDHIIAEKHGGETTSENLCLGCANCNGFKGSDLGSIDHVTDALTPLYHPRRQQWSNHFRLVGNRIEALTPEGRVTTFLLQLNRPSILTERKSLITLGRYPCLAARQTLDVENDQEETEHHN